MSQGHERGSQGLVSLRTNPYNVAVLPVIFPLSISRYGSRVEFNLIRMGKMPAFEWRRHQQSLIQLNQHGVSKMHLTNPWKSEILKIHVEG